MTAMGGPDKVWVPKAQEASKFVFTGLSLSVSEQRFIREWIAVGPKQINYEASCAFGTQTLSGPPDQLLIGAVFASEFLRSIAASCVSSAFITGSLVAARSRSGLTSISSAASTTETIGR